VIQQIRRNATGQVETCFLDRYVASCAVTIYTGSGSAIVTDAACQVDETDSTLSGAAAAGDTDLDITDATDMVVGRRYRLGGTGETAEAFTVRELTSVSAVLVAPLVYAHAAGAAVQGTRAWYDTTAGDAGSLFWDGYAVFQPVDGSREQTESVDCVRRPIPVMLIDETDVRSVFPKDTNALSEEFDYHQGLLEARNEYLIDLGGKNRANTILGVDYHRRSCALKFWLLRRYEFGDEWQGIFDKMQVEYDRRNEKVISTAPVDADQDGATNGPDDRGFTVISLERA
jgi:hypothetical protein